MVPQRLLDQPQSKSIKHCEIIATWFRISLVIFHGDIVGSNYTALWLFLAFQFSIYLAFLSIFRPSGFLFILPSGFGLPYQSVLSGSVTKSIIG